MAETSLSELLRSAGIKYTDEQIEMLERFSVLLLEKNRSLNLTAITDPEEVKIKHFLDSLYLLRYHCFSPGEKVLDLGTGGGFPGIPLKVFFPETEFVLLDSVNKKLEFIREAVGEMGLKKVEVIHGRAEDLAQDPLFRESFDAVVSRAVASLPVLSELSLGFVKPGGVFISYKGASSDEELAASENAFGLMKGTLGSVQSYDLPGGDRRSLIFINKTAAFPDEKYPRKAGIPGKRPL